MDEVGIHEAKTNFSRLVQRAERGEEIAITRNREVVARLVPGPGRARRQLGTGAGDIVVHGDFDDPLPEAVLRGFGVE